MNKLLTAITLASFLSLTGMAVAQDKMDKQSDDKMQHDKMSDGHMSKDKKKKKMKKNADDKMSGSSDKMDSSAQPK